MIVCLSTPGAAMESIYSGLSAAYMASSGIQGLGTRRPNVRLNLERGDTIPGPVAANVAAGEKREGEERR